MSAKVGPESRENQWKSPWPFSGRVSGPTLYIVLLSYCMHFVVCSHFYGIVIDSLVSSPDPEKFIPW